MNSEIAAFIESLNPWAKNDRTIWMTNVLSLSRNLSSYHFPHKMDPETRSEVVKIISKALLAVPSFSEAKVILSEDASANDKEFLFEHFFSRESFQQAHQGEAFVLEKSGTLLSLINVNNHLELILSQPSEEVEEPLNRLVNLEATIGKTLDYAFSPTFGFMTSNPMHCGTGFLARILLQVPALVHSDRLQVALGRHQRDGVQVAGLTGNTQEFVGDLVIVSNSFALGLPEERLLKRVRTLATHLMVEEKSCRSTIKQENSEEMQDKVARAYGLLKHSFRLETFETFNALSLLKLGLDLDWLKGVTMQQLNELFFRIRRGHVTLIEGEEFSHEELPRRRSKIVREALNPMQWAV